MVNIYTFSCQNKKINAYFYFDRQIEVFPINT